jgi:hypothetical protein
MAARAAHSAHDRGHHPVPAPVTDKKTVTGVLTMLASGTSSQVGAGLGAHAFPVIGPAGVVAVRQFVALAVLLPLARPRVHRFTWRQWWPALTLGLVFATMNLTLYLAIERIGLGLAVTLEFLGPLAVALGGSRSRLDALCAVAAGAGWRCWCGRTRPATTWAWRTGWSRPRAGPRTSCSTGCWAAGSRGCRVRPWRPRYRR